MQIPDNKINYEKNEEYVKNKGAINRSEYMALNKISHKTAHLELKKLVEDGVFIQKGQGPSTHYQLRT
jgi:predicted HTH transcriptional regulator